MKQFGNSRVSRMSASATGSSSKGASRKQFSPSREVIEHFVDETSNSPPLPGNSSLFEQSQSRFPIQNEMKSSLEQDLLSNSGIHLVDLEIDHEAHKDIYKEFVCTHLEPDFTLDESVLLDLEKISDSSPDVRVAAYLGIFDILFKSFEDVSAELVDRICQGYMGRLAELLENSEVVMMLIAVETLDLIGRNRYILEGIPLLQELMGSTPYRQVKERLVSLLMKQGGHGIRAIFESASNDYQQAKLWILEHLANTKEIKRNVFVPCCINEIETKENNKRRNQALAILSRFYSCLNEPKSLSFLLSCLKDSHLDKGLVVGCLRGMGVSGLNELLQLLQSQCDKEIKTNVIDSLVWREIFEEEFQLRFRVIEYQKDMSNHWIPGSMFNYKGSMKAPHSIIKAESIQRTQTPEVEIVEINTRDFLAVIKRLISLQSSESSSLLDSEKDYSYFALRSLFQPPEFPRKEETIHKSITDLIAKHLKGHYDPEVREASVTALANIGVPEILQYLENINDALYDENPNVRALAAWSVSKFPQEANNKIIKRLTELLLDIHWKTKVMACISLGFIGEKCSRLALSLLVKVLRDGSINKSTVCETLIRMGEMGERSLIEELKTIKHDHLSLKSIIESFKDADHTKPSIDFVIEEIFKYSTHGDARVRLACVTTIVTVLEKSSMSQIPYLRAKNVLPLLYFFLKDRSEEIRSYSLQSILRFKAQGELMLLEGLSKDQNPVVRAECARGLGFSGPQNLRALLYGMKEPVESVRVACAKAVQEFDLEDILLEFSTEKKKRLVPSIRLVIKEIFKGNFGLDQSSLAFLGNILNGFD